jgi:type IV pilus assembly protein PilF
VNKVILLLLFLLYSCAGTVNEKDDQNFKIAQTNLRLGMGYLQQGRLEDALEKLKRVVAAKPEFPEVYSVLAFVYERMEENGLAEQNYLEAIELKPDDGGAHNNYGVFLCKVGRLSEADSHFNKALNSHRYKTPEIVLENAGTCAQQEPDIERAEIYMRKALSINPELPNALYVMAEIMFERDRYLSARAYLQRYEGVSKHSAQSLWLGIKAERKLGDRDAETRYAKLLQSSYPDSLEFKKLIESSPKEAIQ